MLRLRRRGSSRALTAATAGVALCVVAAACTPAAGPDPRPSPSPPTRSTPTAEPEPVTLELSVYGEKVLRRAYHDLAAAYTDRHPEVTVRVHAWADAETAARQLVAARARGEAPDVFVTSNARLPDLVADGHVRPLSPLLVARGVPFGDGFERLGLVAFSARDALQCMPYDVSPVVVFYNPGLVRLGGLHAPDEEPVGTVTGWTWEQFARAARDASEGTVKGAFVEPRLRTLVALIRSSGTDAVDEPRGATQLTLTDPDTREALETVLSLVRDPEVMPTRKQLERQDGLTRFRQGKVAMLVGTRALVPQLRAAGVDFDVMPLPHLAQPRTVAEVTGFCISAGTSEVAGAADFVEFATGRHGSQILTETGAVVPAHLPTLNSAAFRQPDLPPEHTEAFVEGVAVSGTVPFVPGWARLAESTRPELEKMFYAPVLDLETMLPRLDAESRQVLRPMPP